MTVYIDDMYLHPMGRYGSMKMSHMIADTDEELHALAGKIGVARKHFQGDHYDVCMAMRDLAIGFGAQPVTMKQLSAMLLLKRAGRRLGTPETAIDRYFAWKDSHAAPSPRRSKESRYNARSYPI